MKEVTNIIVHIIPNEKFLKGYIKFMNECMTAYSHCYLVWGEDVWGNNCISEKCKSKYYDSFEDIFRDNDAQNVMVNCRKIIISGIFFGVWQLLHLRSKLLCKTFFQFWGGDFYCYRNITVKNFFKRNLLKIIINKSAGIINLVDEDYDVMLRLFKVKSFRVAHFVAPVVDMENYELLPYVHSNRNSKDKVVVLIGNSAAKENNHKEVFELLAHLKGKIIVVCPLSYGDSEYRKEIIQCGYNMFESDFRAITEFMEKKKYVDLLSKCDVGVFNNDRQQALGNIYLLFRLGKKVYIRNDTSMWNYIKKEGFTVFDIETLKNIDIYDMQKIDLKILNDNAACLGSKLETYKEQWRLVFEG
jgi:hypothetical protein